ncbi:Methyltransferase ausD [Lachnellula suecica]|uniref:Methyltransferase ausD n=1 Tax=Lachnellula suecica TaxID=602035 RepID=A0A8T9CIH9_9HELO|nr:Methyltransferase ausD [Lachnellula suecica]
MVNPSDPQPSEPIWAKEYIDRKDVIWYFHTIDHRLTPNTRRLLETYSNIPPAEILPHVNSIREKAWAMRSHMCTGQGLFLDPTISRHQKYQTILQQLQTGASLVDVGTFIGQDLRRLVVDGAPSGDLYGVDIANHWDVGFDMFRDRDKFDAHYIEADILNPNSYLEALEGKMDIIWVTYLLHQWTWEGQVLAARRLVALSRPGTIVVGFQVGFEVARHQAASELMKGACFGHDPISLTQMWEQVGEETGSKWKTEARFRSLEDMGMTAADLSGDKRILEFTVERMK